MSTVENLDIKLGVKDSSFTKGIDKAKIALSGVSDKVKVLGKNFGVLDNDLKKNKIQWEKMQTTLTKTGTRFDTVGSKMVGAGKAMTLGVTAPIVALGTLFTKYASNLEENLNKANVAFGNNAQEIEKWSNTTLDAYGISQSAALGMASLFGDMGTAMSIPTDQAADMSMELVGLAGDLASFKNIGIDQAETALKGIFTGEGEALLNSAAA